jgi:hypothetical protein
LTGLGSSLFARHYSGSRDFFPFLRLLRCFTSPACRHPPYVFRRGHARITTRRFPHSEIRGSKADQRLTAAYRSRPRPSSASDAKASTACPSYLDDRAHLLPLCSFQGTRARRAYNRPPSYRGRPDARGHRREGRSLKAEQHGLPGRSPRVMNPLSEVGSARRSGDSPGRRRCF